MVHRDVGDGFDERELEVWSSVATMLEWLPAALDGQLQRDVGLTHFEYGVLYALDRSEGRTLRMSVLAGYAHSTLTRLSRAATRLERRGWMVRSPDPSDGRYTLATLTDAGVQKVAEATPGHVALVRSMVFASLSDAQVDQLLRISRRVNAAVRPDGAWTP